MRLRAATALIASTTLTLLLAAAPGVGAATPFFGVMADGPLDSGRVAFAGQVPAMRSAGVQSVRITVYWSDLQPDRADPITFAALDDKVLALAGAGIEVLPVVVRAPVWAREDPSADGSPPRDPSDYGRFLAALVARYGPGGSLWAERPDLPARPVRRWQLWNEPELVRYFTPGRSPNGWARPYVRLLRAGAQAVRAGDPSATIVAAGLTGRTWEDLRKLYAAGAKRWFDVAAIHPFSRRPQNVLKIIALSRAAMARAGDARKPLAVTELTWSSAQGTGAYGYGWETTRAGQAARIRTILPALQARRARWRLAGVWWYTWLSAEPGGTNSFDYSGLRRFDGTQVVDKPALAAFRRVATGR